jgi:hypothetical protein
MTLRAISTCGALAVSLIATGCGYHVSSHANALPNNIKTIAVPAFRNATVRYRLTELLPAAITRDFISRTRYNVVADPNAADAVLEGSVISYSAFPITASAVQVSVHLRITLRDRAGAVLYSRPDFEARERYEISADQRAYLEESDAAMDRLSQYVARMVVSAVLEKF